MQIRIALHPLGLADTYHIQPDFATVTKSFYYICPYYPDNMNIRQWIIYSCCMFAGLILLAHAFVPHIHHDGAICFIKENICTTSNCGHNHSHDHKHGPLDDCKLNDLQIRPEVNESITPDLSDQFSRTYLTLFLTSEFVLQKDIIALKWQPKPYLLLYTSVLADSIHSLRAPPVFALV